jgi:hypothetical protein
MPLPFPDDAGVELSAEWNAALWTRPRYTGRGGLVAVIDAQGHALLADCRDFEAARAVASAKLWVPPTWDVQLTPFEDALGIIAHDLPRGMATVWVVSGREVLEKKGLAALSMPAFATKDVLLTQVHSGALQRVSLRDGASRMLRLPASGRETGLDAHGPGTPIASADVTAFLPWHGESLIVFDAETDEPSEVSRLLPESTRELRQFLRMRVRKLNEAARSTGTRFEVSALHLLPMSQTFSLRLSTHGGDGGFWARTVRSAFHAVSSEVDGRDFSGWRWGGVDRAPDRALMQEPPLPTLDADEVASILGRIDHHGLRVSSVVSVITQLYASRRLGPWSFDGLTPPLTDEAAVLLLQALLVGLGSEAPTALAPHGVRWRQSPMPVSELTALVPRLHPAHALPEPYLLTALARLAAVHLHARAGPLLTALTKKAHRDLLHHGRDGAVEAQRWWARRHGAVLIDM